jgi:hypothetical protein
LDAWSDEKKKPKKREVKSERGGAARIFGVEGAAAPDGSDV